MGGTTPPRPADGAFRFVSSMSSNAIIILTNVALLNFLLQQPLQTRFSTQQLSKKLEDTEVKIVKRVAKFQSAWLVQELVRVVAYNSQWVENTAHTIPS